MAKRRRKPAKGWAKAAPQTVTERRALAEKCGIDKAFLLPDQLKFPIMGKRSRTCKPDCRGLLTAIRRADQYEYPTVARRARALARKAKCSWLD